MLESYLRSERGIARARASLVGPYLDGFAAELRELGYCRAVGRWCISYAVHLGLWAEAEGVAIGALDEESVRAFLAHLSRCQCPGYRAGLHGVARARTGVFVRYLRGEGVVRIATRADTTPALVTGYGEWLRSQRGNAETTVRQYGTVTIALLDQLGDDPESNDAGAVRAAVHAVADGHGIATARFVAKVARGFLRYLAVTGRCRPGLDAAILPVANWRGASLPRYVSADAVQRIIEACDATRPDGVRDRAIVVLLARLGLRAGDVVGLDLHDIDWAGARLRVMGKGRCEARLPLLQEVGDAILAYLRVRRAGVGTDRVFLRARAPWRPLASSSCVSAIVKRAMARAAVDAPTQGAHLLRHSAATAMLRDGVSLPAIGVVLRHRCPETTAHYAKVDEALLRSVAQPWLGGAPC